MKDTEKDLAYYVTIFKLDGHQTWRCHLGKRLADFSEVEMKNWGANPPKVTEKHVLRIDRITGQIKPL